MQYSVSAPLAKSYAGDRDRLDQGLQSKNLDPHQEFGDLTSKLQKWPQVRQAQRPPRGSPRAWARGKGIPEAQLFLTYLLSFRYLQY